MQTEQITHRGTANADGKDEASDNIEKAQTVDIDKASYGKRRQSRRLTKVQQMQTEQTKHRQQTQTERAMEDVDKANN